MWLLPSDFTEISTSVSAAEAAKRVRSLLGPLTESRDEILALLISMGRYSGKTSGPTFRLRRKLEYVDGGYAPLIQGEVIDSRRGSIIRLRFRSYGWPLPMAFAAIGSVLLFPNFAGPFAFAIFYHLVGIAIFRYECSQAEKDLRLLLAGD